MTQSTAFKTEWDKLFIGGKWTEPATADVIEVHSPATGELVGKVPLASKADVDAACAAARKAFDEGPWPHMSPHERAAVLGAAVKLMEERADELKFLLAAETGQPPTIVDMMQYGAAMAAFQYYAGAADKFTWRDFREGVYGETMVLREPIGVVAAVTAWNVPFFLAANKLGPALDRGLHASWSSRPPRPRCRCSRWPRSSPRPACPRACCRSCPAVRRPAAR